MTGGPSRVARGIILVAVAALAGACASTGAPGWTYAVPPTQGAVAGTTGVGASPSPSAQAMPGMSAAPSPAATTAAAAAATIAPDPSAATYQVYDPLAPALLPGTVHDVDFPIIDADLTVAPGYVVHTWTFGGTVPGPTIHVHQIGRAHV